MIKEVGVEKYVMVKYFKYLWGQNSIIVIIFGKINQIVVIGVYQDFINFFFFSILVVFGVDDDGSGIVIIFEVFWVIFQFKDIVKGKYFNMFEFYWYSVEEGGLFGSQVIFFVYEKECCDVKVMFQQDMIGFIIRII